MPRDLSRMITRKLAASSSVVPTRRAHMIMEMLFSPEGMEAYDAERTRRTVANSKTEEEGGADSVVRMA